MAFVKPFLGYAGLDSKSVAKKKRPATASPVLERKQRDYDDLFLRWNSSPKVERKGEVQMLYGHDVNMDALHNGPQQNHFHPFMTVRSVHRGDLLREARELFKLYDKDGNNSLDVVEFKKMLRDAGLRGNLTFREFSSHVRRDFATIDADGNQTVDLSEFVSYYIHVNQHRDPEGHGRGAPGLRRLELNGAGGRDGKGRTKKASQEDKDAKGLAEMRRRFELLRKHVREDFQYSSKLCWLRRTLQAQTKHLKGHADHKLMSLDEACHIGSVPAARYCVEVRGETVCFGGVPPVVRATLNFHFDLVEYLIMHKHLDKTLLDSERLFVVDCCRRKDKASLSAVMRDLYVVTNREQSRCVQFMHPSIHCWCSHPHNT